MKMNIPELVTRKFLFAPDQPITAVLYEISIAQNGVFKRARRPEMTAVIEISAFTVPIRELATESARVELTEKIPARIFTEILAHARASTDAENFTENLYAVCRDEEEAGGFSWKEISRNRAFASTIARDDDPVYRAAILEIHTHPPGCLDFSARDDCDESGKFRLFAILVDIHSAKPAIRLRAGVYDTFREIPIDAIADGQLENLTDLVKQEREWLALQICQSGGEQDAREFIHASELNMSYVDNL